MWRQASDDAQEPVLEIAEVWAAGARADNEIYDEMKSRLGKLKESNQPQAKPLIDVIEQLGRLYSDIEAHPEPEVPLALPEWLARGLAENLHLTHEQTSRLAEEQAQQLMMEHWAGGSRRLAEAVGSNCRRIRSPTIRTPITC